MSQVALKTRSELAKQKLSQFLPTCDISTVNLLLTQTQEAVEYVNSAISPDFTFDIVTPALERARICSTLSIREILSIGRLLRISRLLRESITNYASPKVQLLVDMATRLYFNKGLEELIETCFISAEEVADQASLLLATIRRKMKRVNIEIREKLNSYTRSKDLSVYMQDTIVTQRSGRYVIPIKQEYKGFVKGLIHDQSASGSTVFIEPLAIVNLNNDLKQLEMEESAEIERILIEFTHTICDIVSGLASNQEIISNLDIIFARANYSVDNKSTLPKINNRGYINLIKARHPLLDGNAVPITINLGDKFNVVVITGPNTGGKTVTLKTVGLMCLMAYSGLFIPTQEDSEIACFDDIFCDIGDEQSIEQSLSTFSSHIANIKYITENMTSNCLVLLDELGAGTEPNEGAALALAITQFLLQVKCKAVLTTHYGQLKEFSLITQGIENACMEFNPETFAPTYKLVLGLPGSSNAIEIASRLGLSQEIITNAKSKLSKEKVTFEQVLRRAEEVRQANETDREDILSTKKELSVQLKKAQSQNQILLEERDKLLKKTQLDIRQAVREAQEQANELIEQLKGIINSAEYDEATLFKARSVAKQIGSISYQTSEQEQDFFVGDKINPNQLTLGLEVFVKQLNSVGKVISIEKKGKVMVRCGSFSTKVDVGDLYENHSVKTKREINTSFHTQIRAESGKSEINLLGQTVAEAIENVDAFLDQAALSGLSEVRVVHGKGTGRLRSGLHTHLAKHHLVKEFRLGVYGEGEDGVTIVKLK